MNLQARTLITSLQGPTQVKSTTRTAQRSDVDTSLSFDQAFSAARESRSKPSRDVATQRDLHESLRTDEPRKPEPREKSSQASEEVPHLRERKTERPERSERQQHAEKAENEVNTIDQETEPVAVEGEETVEAAPIEAKETSDASESEVVVTQGSDEEIEVVLVAPVVDATNVEVPVEGPVEDEAIIAAQPQEPAQVAATATGVSVDAVQHQATTPVVEQLQAAPKEQATNRPQPVAAKAPEAESARPVEAEGATPQVSSAAGQSVAAATNSNGSMTSDFAGSQQHSPDAAVIKATAPGAESVSPSSNNSTAPSHVAGTQASRQDGAPAQQAAAQFSPTLEQNLRDEVNVGRVVRGLQSAVNQRGGSVTLRLTPPELGAVRIELMVKDGVVNARFTAQQESVRNLLMDQMGHLRTALDRQGLTVERIEVQTNNSSHGSMQQGQHDGAGHDGRSAQQYTRQQGGQGRASEQAQGESNEPAAFEEQLERSR